MDIQTLTPADVLSVYSGKNGRCCCGCSGKHSYNSASIAEATEHRGYAVTSDEVNDRQITRVLRLIQAEGDKVEDGGNYISVEVGARLYVAYLRKVPNETEQLRRELGTQTFSL
jgi:hypothetical protein